MKKLALTLSLVTVLTVGAQAQTSGKGVIIGGLAEQTQCENVDRGVIIGGLTEGEKKDGKGVIIGGFACEEEKGIFEIIWDSITGVIIGG